MGADDEQELTALVPLVPSEQDTVTFYGHDLVAVRLPDGRIAVVLRWLCDGLGLNVEAQMQPHRGRDCVAPKDWVRAE